MTAVPPIPLRCRHRPTTGGLVIPYINVRLADGGVDFRAQHRRHAMDILITGLCQICGQPLDPPRGPLPSVLIGGPDQLAEGYFDEPPMHPECAAYVVVACPMVAGRRSHFAAGPPVSATSRGARCHVPGCGCSGWHNDANNLGPGSHAGEPNHPWLRVWVRRWDVAVNDRGEPHGVKLSGPPLKVRQVTS